MGCSASTTGARPMRIRIVRVRTALTLLLSFAAASTAFAQGGNVTGRVTERASGTPLGDVRITVVGSTAATMTNAEGRYTLRGVRAGRVTLRALRLGYEESSRIFTVTAGADTTVDFALSQAVQKLPGVVMTATGQERRIEVGNSIGSIEAADRVKTNPIHNMGELLAAKAPGLTVMPAAMTGGGHTIRIRGLNSLDKSNEPIFVIDGIRVDGGGGGIAVGGTSSSRLNDLTPEEIENIEVVRGPSAATLYGTNAANGVIVITTKKGRAGPAQWNWSSEYGTIEDHNNYPKTYAIWGRNATSGAVARCTIVTLAQGTCLRDSVTSAHMLRKDGLSPIGTGNRQLHTLQVSGGSDVVRYFVSGTTEGENGPIRMPSTDEQYLRSSLIVPREEWTRPEHLNRGSFRANLNAVVNPRFDLNVQTMFMRSEQRLPQVDNNVNSFYYNALTNPGFHPGPNCAPATPCLGYTNVGNLGQPLNGWAQFTPGDIFQRTRSEDVKRFLGGSTASWRPLPWLQTDGTVGIDLYAERAFQICRLNECPNFGTQRQGSVLDNHLLNRVITANLRSSARYQATADLNLRAVVGGDYTNDQIEESRATGSILPPGGQTVGSGAVPSAGNTLPSATKTLGYYAQGEAAWRERLWVTAALRTDQNTAFGTKYSGVVYPKFSLSWAASEESFFPRFGIIDEFRLRGAYGASGVQPGATDALRTFSAVTVSVFTDQPALLANEIGNPNLKPELTKEFETGFDVEAWRNKIRLELTYYSKLTQDALIEQDIASSTGSAATDVLRNLGKVKNAGVEALLDIRPFDTEMVGLDVTLAASHNDNKVVTLGEGIPTIGTTRRTMAGYPMDAYFLIPYTYNDANNDGMIEPAELSINRADTSFVGPAFAPDQASVALGPDLLRRQMRVNASFDHRSGHAQLTNTHSFLCAQSVSHEEVSNPATPLDRQARCVAARVGVTANGVNTRTNRGFYENGQFWRFRELSLTYSLPQNLTSRYIRYAEALSVPLGARNLKVGTKYTGEDPEANYSAGDVPSTLLTTAPRRYYTARVNVQF